MTTDHRTTPGDAAWRIAGHLRIHPVGGDVLVVGEDGVSTVRGRAAALLTRLDPSAPTSSSSGLLVGAAPEELPVLEDLVRAGLVEPGAAAPDPRAVFHRAAAGPGVAARPRTTVGLVDLGDAAATDAVRGALAAGGAALDADRPDCVVVVVADHLDPRLADLGDRLRAAGTPWLPVRARGVRQWIGPFLGAVDGGPCWHCLAARLWSHRRAEEALQAARGVVGPMERSLPTHPATLGIVAHAVALEVDAWSHGWNRPVTRGVVVHDQRAGTTALHELRRRPQCAGCGDPGLVARHGEVPVQWPDASTSGGEQEPLEAGYHHLVSPVTGVVPALEVVASPVVGVRIARTGPTRPARPVPMAAVRAWSAMGNGGSGRTERQARSSALGEAIERWSGQFHGDEARVRARRDDLGDEAVDPREVLLVDGRQSADHEAWNADHGPFNRIGPAVDDTEETDWTPLWSLRDGARRLLPTAMLFHGAPGPAWALADSSGCAAGPSLDEATRRGLLELVERDAVALWWYHRATLPGVPIDDAARAAHHAVGRDVWALDLTADLGIPVVAAVSARAGHRDRVMFGFAADSDPARATDRALLELAAGTGAVLDHPVTADPDSRRWFDQTDVADEPWLRPHGTGRPGGIGDGVEALVDRLTDHGLEPLVLDQTRPDVGLPVVRTVVPGLRPMWARFAPGRLFEVPVVLGRQAYATAYEDLNPRAVFL